MAEARDKKVELVEQKKNGRLQLTKAGRDIVEELVTDIDGNVYSFLPASDGLMVSAAMARLSRNSNDLRTIMASEFIGKGEKESGLLRRVVTEFGDDSVMQLYSMQVVFEGISNIATKEVEWGRFAAYLEQSTRYLRFDVKDDNGHYSYYTPEEFDANTAKKFESYIDQIFDIYSALYEKMYTYIQEHSSVPEAERDAAWLRACHAQACDSIRALLPSATKATVGMVGSAQAIHNMILHMDAHPLPEMNRLAEQVLEAVRGVAPVFFERTDRADRGKLISGHQALTQADITKLVASHLDKNETEPKVGSYVDLVSVDGSEDELVAKIMSDVSNQPHEVIQGIVDGLSAKEKEKVITTYVGDRYNRRAKPGRAFEYPHYNFEIQCDYGAFRDIQRHRVVDGMKWQLLQTELGHVRQNIIDEAGFTKEYEKAFELSKELYDFLKSAGYELQAQYATLFGHNMRFSMKVNARALMQSAELRTSPQGHPSYRKIYQEMHERVAEVHPLIAKAMRFVSADEDEELARLGAERYQQQRAE
jgi:thymidylate synthase ThyX